MSGRTIRIDAEVRIDPESTTEGKPGGTLPTTAERKGNKADPTEAALAAAYQVTARWFASEQQLIWRRTSLFVTLNSLVAAALHYWPNLHISIYIVGAALGFAYSICWHFSMRRAWEYQAFQIRMMREQEDKLNLGEIGAFTRGKKIVDAPLQQVAGEKTEISSRRFGFRARTLANATTWLFAAVYLIFLIIGLIKLVQLVLH